MSNSDNENNAMPTPSKEPSISEEVLNLEEAKGNKKPHPKIEGGTIATLSRVPKYQTFKIKGVIRGQRIIALIDGGATYNFIDVTMVVSRGTLPRNLKVLN